MAFVSKARISLILLLCLVNRNGCERTGPFNPAEALVKAKNAAAGKLGPDVKTFNVLDYGAKANGKTDSSINFIRTFKAACNFRGNAMMVIPKGDFLIGPIIFQGPCFNPSSLIIQANGIVKAQADLSYFTGGADDTDWITFQSINGLILSGTGTFHGQGAKAWKYNDCAQKSHCVRLAANFKFNKVNDAIINGINSIDPKGFHIMVTVCRNFRLLNLKLQAPGDSPNTDGIHISKSNVVKIAHCVIGTGDDCVSMIHGSIDISVNKVICGPGHGFSVGSLGHYDDEADVNKIVVTNSSLTDTTNGVRIKTYKTDSPSKASSILFTDLIMNRVKNPIIIDQEYGNRRSTQSQSSSVEETKLIIRENQRSPENGFRQCPTISIKPSKPRPLFFFFLSFPFSPHSCSPQQNPSFYPRSNQNPDPNQDIRVRLLAFERPIS